MSTPPSVARPAVGFPLARPLPISRWGFLIALLVTELVVLTLRFDTESLRDQPGGWAEWLGRSYLLPRLGIVIAAATVLLGGRRLWRELEGHSAALGAPNRWRLFLLAHLTVFGGFALLTGFVLEGGVAASGRPELWAAVWAAVGLAVFVTWCAAAVSPALWPLLLKRLAALLAVGIVVGLAAWTAGEWAGELWRPFRDATFCVVRGLLRLSGADLVCDPAQAVLGTTAFAVRIAPECSGYEGMGLIAVFMGGYLWFFRRRLRFPVVLLLLPVGVAAMWLLNAARIAALVLIGTWGSPEVARGGFHSQAGWLAFNAVALGLVAASGRLRFLQSAASEFETGRNATAAYLAPFCAILLVTMLTRAISAGFDWLYPLRVLTATAVLWSYRRQYGCLRGWWSWPAFGVGAAAFLLWLALVPGVASESADKATSAALAGLPAAAAIAWIAFRLVGAAVTVPLAEELAFRGYLLRRLSAADFERVDPRKFSPLAFVVSSALFGVLHASWLAGTVVGMMYAWAYYRRGRLLDAVLAHATTNGLLAIYVVATGRWSLWG